MKKNKLSAYKFAAAAVLIGVASSCATRPVIAPKCEHSELLDKGNVYEVIAHLYRWYFDEVDVQKSVKEGNKTVWVRKVEPVLDKDDKSLFGEIFLPVLDVSVQLKKADYTVPELGMTVKSDRFVITRVDRVSVPRHLTSEYIPVTISGPELRKYLFNKRGEVMFPDEKLIDRLRDAVRKELEMHFKDKGEEPPKGDAVVHFSPLSPVAHEVWAFWEGGRVLVRFSADMSLLNENLWDHETISADVYDIDEQVVVSLQEVPGSNAYMTRDQVGRALYNCIILGRRYDLKPRK